jgi:hypothetical protein
MELRAVWVAHARFLPAQRIAITVNVYVPGFSAGVSVLTGMLFGRLRLDCSRINLVETLKNPERCQCKFRGGVRTCTWFWRSLSVVLLVGAGLTVRGFLFAEHGPGFQRIVSDGRRQARKALRHLGQPSRVRGPCCLDGSHARSAVPRSWWASV